ncbi:MAG TPA: hypothetical protein VJC37_06655 [Planctomycetota bacterium]|nr:hypothetical protein [Planctomycetota bacterium]
MANKANLIVGIILILSISAIHCGGPKATGARKMSIKSQIPSRVSGTAVVLESVAPDSVSPNSSNVPVVHFAMATNQSDIVLKSLKFAQTGTLKDADIKAIKLYLDNGDESFNTVTDILLSSSQLKGDACEFSLEQPIISRAQSFFIAVDLASSIFGTVSFVFNAESFGTTDIVGVTGKYPFSSAPMNVAVTAALAAGGASEKPAVKPPAAEGREKTAPEATDDAKDIMFELEKEKTVKMQENEFLAQKYYEMGLKLFKEFNYAQALDKVAKAVELNPQHKEAKKLYSEIQLVLGSRADEIKVIKEFLQEQLAVKIQETELVVRNHFMNGERLTAEKKYGEARVEFEAVINKLKWMPYEIGLKEYMTKAQERLTQIQDFIVKQEEDANRQRREAAARIAQEEELKRQQEYNEKIKSLFKEALIFFEQKRFEKVEALADTLLELAPHFKSAEELKKEAIRARHYEVSEKYIKLRSERFKAMYDDFKETTIPYADDKVVRYDPDVWKIASKRKSPGVITGKSEEDPDIAEIKRKLKTIRHDFKLEGNDTLYDVTDYIQQQYKIPIIYAADVKQEGIPNEKKTLSLTGLPLEIGLKNLLEQYGLSYGFDKDVKSLKITKVTALEEELEWRVHNVDDLVRAIPEFPGPNVELPLTPGGAPGWAMPQTELPPVTQISIEDLLELIKKNTGKDRNGQGTWEGNIPGVNIRRIGDSNKLMVVHSASVQEEIVEFLQILRSFRSAMVSIEATFTTTTDDFFEEFGMELRNIPRSTIPNAPDIPGQSNPSAGLLLGGNRDARFRTAYTLRDQNNQVETALPPSAVGGLGLQFAILGSPRVNMLMSALEKTGKGTIMDSPKITALNGQRVNVAFIRQRQYIQDGDIQAGAVAYEPVINTFSTGVVLDVKPVMSYDRKFITIHVFPTLLELVDVRNLTLEYFASPPGIATELSTQISIELPWLRLQRCRTSAVVPDEGALVLGGMKTIYDRDITASTPMMDKIPILSAFFKRKIKSEEKRYQLVIVRAKIVELPEIEQDLR